MSVAEQTPTPTQRPARETPRQNGRWSGYSHLLMARMLELKREPEVVFWVFIFPLLLALGLGIAFRNKPGNIVSVAIVQSAGWQEATNLLARSPQRQVFSLYPGDWDWGRACCFWPMRSICATPGSSSATPVAPPSTKRSRWAKR